MPEPAEKICVFTGAEIAAYGFGEGHPFGSDRLQVFTDALRASGLEKRVCLRGTATASDEQLMLFHSPDYIRFVRSRSADGNGYFDQGDTPVVPGIFAAAVAVVGTALAASEAIMSGDCRRAFVPIAGLHHCARDRAAGFCVFNDCGVVLESLHRQNGLQRIAYVDIDAHHGDGVYYAFENTPWLYFVDLHEDGQFLYPGTGAKDEQGKGAGRGRKLNLPMTPGAGDDEFFAAWENAEHFLRAAQPEFIVLQCGADSLAGDPITHLRYSEKAHLHAAQRLALLSEELGHGRLLALGGGGYHRPNLARAWCAIVAGLLANC